MELIKFPYVVSKEVTSFDQIKADAEELKEFVVKGPFKGEHREAYAIHHSQVNPEPYNFFVIHPKLTLGESEEALPHRIIINPKIIKLVPVERPPYNKEVHGPNEEDYYKNTEAEKLLFRMDEGCMSFPFRKAKKVERALIAEVEFQYPEDDGSLKTVRRMVYNTLAQLFQHECEHADGKNIFFEHA